MSSLLPYSQRVTSRWRPRGALTNESRVELWSDGELVDDAAPIIGGQVTEHRVTGIRATLTLDVEPSGQWRRWLRLPNLELRPFAGMSWGAVPELIPLGRFPFIAPVVPDPLPAAIQIQANDWWGWAIGGRSFRVPMTARRGTVRDAVSYLMGAWVATLPWPTITATSRANMPAGVVWDGRVQDTIDALCKSIGAESFVDRSGEPRVADRVNMAAPSLTDSTVDGTVMSVTPAADRSQVFNSIAVSSSNQDIQFDPVVYTLNNPNHPADPSNIGLQVAPGYSSPYFRNRAQAVAAAPGILAKYIEPQLSWRVECLPDPARTVGDTQTVSTLALGAASTVVTDAVHDLAGAPLVLTMGTP